MSDPKKDLHASQSFLSVVLEALVLAVFVSTTKILSLDCSITAITKHSSLTSPAEKTQFITKLASLVVDFVVLHPLDETLHSTDDTCSDMSRLLSMGLLAWNIEDAIREGDGDRMLRIWNFLLLQFRQAGKTKYTLEALHLLCDVKFRLTQKQSFALMYNRTCNTHGGIGGNKPLDLHIEHINRNFKDDIILFAPHVSEVSVEKTSHAAPVVSEFVVAFDKSTGIPQDSGIHVVPQTDSDRQTIFNALMQNNTCKQIPGRKYIHFQDMSSYTYAKIRKQAEWAKFQGWITDKLKEFASEQQYKEYKSQQSL